VLLHEHSFTSKSDSEMVIPLYKRYGVDFQSRLRDEFAVYVYDSRLKRLAIARDRLGIKPLFWTRLGGQIFIASEMKAFLELGWRPNWDVRSIRSEAWLYDDRTIFQGVKTILPGRYAIVESDA